MKIRTLAYGHKIISYCSQLYTLTLQAFYERSSHTTRKAVRERYTRRDVGYVSEHLAVVCVVASIVRCSHEDDSFSRRPSSFMLIVVMSYDHGLFGHNAAKAVTDEDDGA